MKVLFAILLIAAIAGAVVTALKLIVAVAGLMLAIFCMAALLAHITS
jgi:hypothetical protein